MTLVYVHCKPQVERENPTSNQIALDTLFAEDAELERGSRIFVDLQKLRSSSKDDKRPASMNVLWSGLDESRLTEVGWIKTTIKKKTADATRAEKTSTFEMQLSAELINIFMPNMGLPKDSPLKIPIYGRIREDISLDQGVETFDMEISLGLADFKLLAHGVRDGDTLNVIKQVMQGSNKLLDQKEKLKDAPAVELFPFQPTTLDIRQGTEWTISTLDATSIDLTGSTPPRVVNTRVRCTGKRRIFYDKEQRIVFEVRTDDNQARAWYSADGVVLKQTCRFLDAFEVMVVRIEPKQLKNFTFERTQNNSSTEKQGASK
jgi:hypothetical protein